MFENSQGLPSFRYSCHKVSNVMQEKGSNSFFLSLNAPYGHAAISASRAGERVTADYGNGVERIDNDSFGCTWTPGTTPGMALSFAPVRHGGTSSLIIPNLLNYGGNAVVNDPTGELAWITAPRRRTLGHKVVIFDWLGKVDRSYGSKVGVHETVTRYNPLHDLDPASADFADDVDDVAYAFAADESAGRDDSAAAIRDLIKGLIAAVIVSSPPGRAVFREVRGLLKLDSGSFESYVTKFCASFPSALGAKKLQRFQDMNDNTALAVKAKAEQTTRFLDNEQLLQGMEPGPSEPSCDLKELATGALDVFLVFPAEYAGLVRMLLKKSMRAVFRSGGAVSPTLPVVYFLDEAAGIGHVDTIELAYSLTESVPVLIWSFYKTIAELQMLYPKAWQQIINNSTIVTLMALEAKQVFSQFLGNPAVGRSLNDDDILVLYSRQANFVQHKLRYYEDPRFNGKYRFNPHLQTSYPAGAGPRTSSSRLELESRTAQIDH